MNARARKGRLILRHHRRVGPFFHFKKVPGRPLYQVWWCTHCASHNPDIPLWRLLGD